MLGARTTDDFLVGLLTRISWLRTATLINRITFTLQNIKSLSQLLFRNTKFQVSTSANVNHTFTIRIFRSSFFNTLSDKLCSITSLHGASFRMRIEKGTNSRFRETEFSTDFSIAHSFFFFHSFSSLNLIDSTLVIAVTLLESELTSRRITLFIKHSHLSGDINFSHALLLEFVIAS